MGKTSSLFFAGLILALTPLSAFATDVNFHCFRATVKEGTYGFHEIRLGVTTSKNAQSRLVFVNNKGPYATDAVCSEDIVGPCLVMDYRKSNAASSNDGHFEIIRNDGSTIVVEFDGKPAISEADGRPTVLKQGAKLRLELKRSTKALCTVRTVASIR